MKKIVFATGNPGKLKELKEMFQFPDVTFCSLEDFEGITEVEEDGHSFEENAIKKALGYAEQTGLPALADDSGLCVDYLNGSPGIYSSRYAGIKGDGLKNCEKVLEELKDCPPEKRTAKFIAALVLAEPGKVIETCIGECHGLIANSLKGDKGFGYDPIFYFPEFQKTFGEVDKDQKNKVSHRYNAFLKMHTVLENYLLV